MGRVCGLTVELTTGEKVPMTKRNRAQLISSLMDCTNIQSGIDDDAKKEPLIFKGGQ